MKEADIGIRCSHCEEEIVPGSTSYSISRGTVDLDADRKPYFFFDFEGRSYYHAKCLQVVARYEELDR